ncbi:phage virion morphogenesis protein [Psychromonas sp. MME2]|uniref:phage virion morphogenesis protein n=1 Tax=unclassified Psychromonas TaxID=2614957 RepID=UPI00339D0D7E
MAGAFLSVDLVGQQSIADTLQQLANRTNNLTPALSEVGEYLKEIHAQRFKDQVAPDGTPWQAVRAETLKNKKRPDRILREEGTLADLLTYQIGDQQLSFGTNMVYGATHQFGREDANIVAREWLGLNSEQEQSVLDILVGYIQTA